jgi:hypothetical protein
LSEKKITLLKSSIKHLETTEDNVRTRFLESLEVLRRKLVQAVMVLV